MVGVCLTLFAALHARSVACAGFGLAAVIAIGASRVGLWQLTGTGKDWQHRARRRIRTACFARALARLVHASRTLDWHRRPATSLPGIAWWGRTFVALLALACGTHRVGTHRNHPVWRTAGGVTLVEAYCAGAVVLGLVRDAAGGWWWAAPFAGLVLVCYGCTAGVQAWAEGAESVQASSQAAQQRPAADAWQPPLVPRYGCQPRLMPSVRAPGATRIVWEW